MYLRRRCNLPFFFFFTPRDLVLYNWPINNATLLRYEKSGAESKVFTLCNPHFAKYRASYNGARFCRLCHKREAHKNRRTSSAKRQKVRKGANKRDELREEEQKKRGGKN